MSNVDERVCKNCETIFTRIVRAGQLYCTPKCRKDFWNKECSSSSPKWHKSNPAKVMLRSARHRAKKQGLPFNITIDDIVIPEVCPVLGIQLECNAGTGSAKQNSPSLDKIIPELGYVVGNVQVISYLANVMKHDATPEQLINFALWVLETYKEKELEE